MVQYNNGKSRVTSEEWQVKSDMLRVVRDGLVGKLQVVSSSYIGILSKDTYHGTVYIGWQVVQVDR